MSCFCCCLWIYHLNFKQPYKLNYLYGFIFSHLRVQINGSSLTLQSIILVLICLKRFWWFLKKKKIYFLEAFKIRKGFSWFLVIIHLEPVSTSQFRNLKNHLISCTSEPTMCYHLNVVWSSARGSLYFTHRPLLHPPSDSHQDRHIYMHLFWIFISCFILEIIYLFY